MNFENMPELSTRHGYFIILGALAVIGVTLLVVFRRLGWVGTGLGQAR